MYVEGLPGPEAQFLAHEAVQIARKLAPKLSGNPPGASPRSGETASSGSVGRRLRLVPGGGIHPFTMRSLAGKTIPMWINDPTGEERQKNPRAQTRVTASGKTQVTSSARRPPSAHARPSPGRRLVETSRSRCPSSYPGAPGRIGTGSLGGPGPPRDELPRPIARRNVGVRWRHPGLARRSFIRQGHRARRRVPRLRGRPDPRLERQVPLTKSCTWSIEDPPHRGDHPRPSTPSTRTRTSGRSHSRPSSRIERSTTPASGWTTTPSDRSRSLGSDTSSTQTSAEAGYSRRFTRWRFQGEASFTVVAMSSLERDRLYDEVVKVIAFGTESEQTSEFRTFIEDNEFLAVNFDFDEIETRGFAATLGTPWQTDEMIYEGEIAMECFGEFISDGQSQTLVPISAIQAIPYSDQETDPTDEEGWV